MIKVLAGVAVVAACQSNDTAKPTEEPTTPAAEPAPRPRPLTEQEVRSPYRDPALAFKKVDSAYRASYQTHQVSIVGGVVEMTPQRASGERGSAMRFQTELVARGESGFALSARTQTLSHPNELRIQRSTNLVEEIENREEGVEQRWHFDTLPTGEGDLFVKVAVDGFDPDRTISSNGGLHFFAAKGLGFRYSHAKWIDSAGGAWDIGSRWEGGRIVMRVDEHILAQTKFPAVLDPTIEAEEAVDDPVLGNSGANAFAPSIGTRGDGYLAVWADQRASNRSDIYAARLTASGLNLDYAGGLVVNAAADTQTTPVVARVGSNWLVVWRTVQDLAAATVDDNGTVTQLGSVAASAANDQLPSIASDGSTAVVTWQSGNDIHASYFNGSFGAATPIATAGNEADPSVAASPAGYVVSWHDDVGVKAQLLTSGGAISGTVVDVAPSSSGVAAAFNGTDYVLVYTFGNDVAGSRVSTAGVLVDAMPVPLGVATGLQSEATVSCNSSNCTALWSDTRTLASTGFDVYGRTFDFTMVPVGAEFLVSGAARYQVTPSIASTQIGYIGIWEDQRTGGASIAMASRIGNDSSVQDAAGFVVNASFNAQQEAATATAATGSQVVMWSDSRNVGNDVLAVRYGSVGGGRLDSPPKTVSDAAGDQATPSVSFDGTQFLAVWGDARGTDRDIYATRFGTDGSTTDATGIAVSTAAGIQGAPDVASGNGVSLVVWADRRSGGFDIYGAVVSQSGAVTVADIAISTEQNDQNAPAVVYDASSNVFVVIWSDQRTLQSGDIYGTRVSTAGVVLDPGGVPITTSQFEQVQPDLAISGNTILAVWDDRRSDPLGDIIGATITTAGNALTVGNVLPISHIPVGRQNSPAVIGMPNGNFLVAWTDHRDAATVGSDIYGVTVNAMGQPADTTGFAIAGGAGDQGGAGFQSDPNSNSRVAMVYSYYRADLKVSRVFRRLITVEPTGASGAPNGTICQLDSQCSSGFCIDAMCCNSQCGGNFNQTDCQTCNTIYGGTVDGQCTVIVVEAICRNFGTFDCDIREYCDGVNPSCPPDDGRNQGQACTTPGGQPGTCPADAPPGPHVCQ